MPNGVLVAGNVDWMQYDAQTIFREGSVKIKNVLIAPIGIITFPEREREDQLLLSAMDYVGHHLLCSGHVIFLEGTVAKTIPGWHSSKLKCARCNIILMTFPAEVRTYGELRRHFEKSAGKYMV